MMGLRFEAGGRRVRWTPCCVLMLLAVLAANSAQSRPASLILLIWTENPGQPEAEAIAIDGERIQSVGTSEAVSKLAGPDCRIIDLGGRRVVPGLSPGRRQMPGRSQLSLELRKCLLRQGLLDRLFLLQ